MQINLKLERFLILVLIAFHISLFLPLQLDMDAISMFKDAQNLRFKDYWPPLSLLLWHGLNYLKPGGELMLLVNLSLLWGACWQGYILFKPQKISYWFLILPFYPSIFLYADIISKDSIFSFGYMAIAMFLAVKTCRRETLALWQASFMILGLLYFTMAKVQGKFIFPFMVFWIIWLQPSFSTSILKNRILKFMAFLGCCGALFISMDKINASLIKQENNAHFWQYVKIYDLAGMSVFAKKMYVPAFLHKRADITVEDIEKSYDYLWEPLIRFPTSPLTETKNDLERTLLVEAWQKAVLSDPWAYLKHRGRLWLKIMTGSVVKGKFIEKVDPYFPTLLKIAPIFSIFSFLPLFPIFIYIWFLGVKNWQRTPYAIPTTLLSSMGLMLILVLTIFSLAAAGRYIYFSWCCFMFSLPFAYKTYREMCSKKSQPV